jgi:hypothetical protein
VLNGHFVRRKKSAKPFLSSENDATTPVVANNRFQGAESAALSLEIDSSLKHLTIAGRNGRLGFGAFTAGAEQHGKDSEYLNSR